MKVLFQGGWKVGRNTLQSRSVIEAYCRALGEAAVRERHTLVLSSNRDTDRVVADAVEAAAREAGVAVKDHLTFLLPQGGASLPAAGRVITVPSRWLTEARTYAVRNTDAIVAIGGGKGTFDCVEKAFLSNKPVFVAKSVQSPSVGAWNNRPKDYRYLEQGDADVFDDVNVSPQEFCRNVFAVVNSLAEVAYPRRIFIVHGHDLHLRDQLKAVLLKLQFEPIILQHEANKGLTVMEKLERDTERAGFAFVLYTPDDFGRAKGETEQERARQNVIFEHGLLIGLLGRERTCAIIKGSVEVPSDVHGMIYENITDIRKDELTIARILKEAGYKVDVSKLL